jgi:hypothetical protein
MPDPSWLEYDYTRAILPGRVLSAEAAEGAHALF